MEREEKEDERGRREEMAKERGSGGKEEGRDRGEREEINFSSG